MADPNVRRPIFIIGCVRSGTTLLRAMMNAHPNIAIPYEAGRFSTSVREASPWTKVWTRREVQQPIEEFFSNQWTKFWKLDTDKVICQLGDGKEFRFEEILSAIYRTYAIAQGKERWGDKTPFNVCDLSELKRVFPQAKFVHIVRDGRDA